MTVKIEVEHHVYELEDLWEQRQAGLEQEEKSLKGYEGMNDEYREALADLVDQALEKMRADKSWLPYSLDVQEGSCVDVKVRILFSDITEEIIKRRATERKQILEARDDTEHMIVELEGDDEDEVAVGGE